MQGIKPEIILALDSDSLTRAQEIVDRLFPKIKSFKIGSQLFTAYGPQAVEMVAKKGGRVFLDLKFHDIPKTVSSAVESGLKIGLPGCGVFMLTVHVQGGRQMLEAAAKTAAEKSRELKVCKPFIVGVTRLTSDASTTNTADEVVSAAKLAKAAGLDGVVCSALEAAAVRQACGDNFIIVTPGIRGSQDALGDQKRTATAAEAVRAGSNFLVIGRPILEAKDPLKKTEELLGDLYGAGN